MHKEFDIVQAMNMDMNGIPRKVICRELNMSHYTLRQILGTARKGCKRKYSHLLPKMKKLRGMGLTYKQISEVTGVSANTVMTYLNGVKKR